MSVATQQRWEPYNREEVSRWMRQMPNSYREWLERERELEVQQVCTASDLTAIMRSQGRVEVLDRILLLRKDV